MPRSSWLCSRITDALRTGQVMAQFSENRRQASRATNALIFAAALLAPAFMATQASAQVLSYAPAASSAFPSDDAALALPEDEFERSAGAAAPRRGCLRHQRSAGHRHHRYRPHRAVLCARPGPRRSLWRRRRPRRLYLVRRADHQPQGGVAGLASAGRDDRAPALSAALHGGRPRQSAGRARHVSRHQRIPHPRHQRSLDHRQVRVLGLHPPDQ